MPGRKLYNADHTDPVVRRLETVRERLRLSQARMADALGVPFRTYQKWVYGRQKPRHGPALTARAEGMLSTRRSNCWEVLGCGREPGGSKVHLDGPCPAVLDECAHGVNNGCKGGRVCWAISGTFCGTTVNGSQASKLLSCFSCEFFHQVLQEEGLANFKLLKPGQSYTQA